MKWVVGCMMVLGALASGSTARADSGTSDAFWSALYREDAFAQFVVPNPECELGRTEVQFSFHQDYFKSSEQHRVRSVVFGVAIQEFDCAGQLTVVAEGSETFSRPFDIKGNLREAEVDTTIEACVVFPVAGECFEVSVDIQFTGVGEIDVDRDRVDIVEPDCRIRQRSLTKTRTATVEAEVSYALPGSDVRTLDLDTADLGPVGATLSSQVERSYIRGSSGSCIEQ